MSTVCWTVCKALIENTSPSQRKELLSFLPSDELEAIEAAPLQKTFFSTISSEEIFQSLHPSWLQHFLHAYPENEQLYFLAALPTSMAEKIKKNFPSAKPLPKLTEMGKSYFRHELLSRIQKERGEALPQASLPESPMNLLLDLEASQFTHLAFWLGLYDLAEELRFVIDKQTLQRVETSLSPSEWQLLKSFQTKKDRVSFGRMPLKTAIDSPTKIRLLIGQYGMNRIAKALYGESKSLIWHLSLLVDDKRAEFLSRFCTPLSKPNLQSSLQSQVLALVRTLLNEQKKGTP